MAVSPRNLLICFGIAARFRLSPQRAASRAASSDRRKSSPNFRCPTPTAGRRRCRLRPTGRSGSPRATAIASAGWSRTARGLKEFDLPHPGSAPRIITIGSDGNMWFSEHLGNRMGRITPAGVISEFEIPTPDSQPRATALGRRRQRVVRRVRRRKDRPHDAGGRRSPSFRFRPRTAGRARSRPARTATSGFRNSTRARSAA